MHYNLPKLPYKIDALEPYISGETLEYHYGKHHQTYVNNLNKLIDNTIFFDMTLEEIILSADGDVFNNASQIWNHTFYFNCLTPTSNKTNPKDSLIQNINNSFGSMNNFKQEFSTKAISTFGSGWSWLLQNKNQELEIVSTSNAMTPLTDNKNILLTCDIWEHAYYIDYRNNRSKYLDAFWKLVNWNFVNTNYKE